MSEFNGFLPGVASQTVGYEVRGGSDDWLYNDSAHSKIISLTPEIGTGRTASGLLKTVYSR